MSKEEILDFAKNHPFKDHKKLQLTEKEAGFSWVVENSELIRFKETFRKCSRIICYKNTNHQT